MRHNKKFNHLSRKKAHRDALLANMTISLIMHKRIFTTLAKAKALRVYAEPLINRAKEDSTPNRRLVFAHLQNKEAVTELFREIAQKIANRPGGYTRILKTGNRLGDNAKTCFIESRCQLASDHSAARASAAGVSAWAGASAVGAAFLAPRRERRVRVCFLPPLSLSMFSSNS